jgi:UDP-N-acetylmuramate dehydrogenase
VAGSDFGGAAVAGEVSLAPLTTLRVGPTARRLITCVTTEQIIAVLRQLDGCEQAAPPLVLAGGSNLVIADDLADLTVVRLASSGITLDGNLIRAEAGAVWDDVVRTAVAAEPGGLECLSGIPGSAGATPVQNVGAYGAEVAHTITRVRLLDRRTGEVAWVPGRELGFGYRTSLLKHPRTPGPAPVALEVEFALDAEGRSAPLRYPELTSALGAEPGQRADPAQVRAAVLALRRRKAMVIDDPERPDHDTWSVGSFFTNPVVAQRTFEQMQARAGEPIPHHPAGDGVKLVAAWLVEHAGFEKGFPGEGAPARLSTRHTLALTNRGTATSADIIALARRVRDGVFATYGVQLVPEPVLVGCVI